MRLMGNWGRVRISIRMAAVLFLVVSTLLTASVAISLQYFFSKKMATESTLSVYQKVAASTRDYLRSVENQSAATTRILSEYTRLKQKDHITKASQQLFAEAMQRNPLFASIYVGFGNGDLYEVINLDNCATARQQLNAHDSDHWVVITVASKGKERVREVSYYDAHFKLRSSRKHLTDFDARTRPWFINAKRDQVYKTSPYLFQNLQAPGQTYSIKIGKTHAVLAVDIALSSLSDFIKRQKVASDSQIFLYQGNGELIASTQPQVQPITLPAPPPLKLTPEQQKIIAKNPELTVSNETDWPPIDFAVSGKPYGYSIDILSAISSMTGIKMHYVNGLSWKELAETFLQGEVNVMQPVFFNNYQKVVGTLTDPFVTVPYGVITKSGGKSISHIQQLAGKTVAIPQGWSLIDNLKKHFPDINVKSVATVRDMFKAVRNGQADAGIDIAATLQYTAERYFINDVHISEPLDFSPVTMPTKLHFLISKARPGLADIFNLALAKLGSNYLNALNEKWFGANKTITHHIGTVQYAELLKLAHKGQTDALKTIKLNGQNHFVYVTPIGDHKGQHDFIAMIRPVRSVLAPGLEKVKTSIIITSIALLLLLPISWFFASPIIRSIHRLAQDSERITQRRYDQVESVDTHIAEVNDLSNAMMTMSESIQSHEKSQEALLDAFIQLIAQAIDDKSPYTAGHCERVPELAFMLAEKAIDSEDGSFKDFRFDSEQEWREFRVAAWLHDCGKITTPEHIVDKGTKLETIYNRIHEIRMRFEVLWRDAEIAYLEQTMAEPDRAAEFKQLLQNEQSELQRQYAFIANINIGAESVQPEDIEHLKQLAEITWQRHFDDRLGLSPIEEARLSEAAPNLPVTEKLLSDRPEHIIERLHSTDYDPRFGIKMEVPEHLYNLGEVYNLSISSGTLTKEDRFKINEHIISTIKMLENLPLPPELAKVPRYASTHHENMKGTGYPRKLSGDELSVPERIMVLADIFEALTAADRPYKKAKTVSTAIAILHKMVLREHVDMEVFELFLRSGVYLDYAKRFLPDSQIDDVDIEQYLNKKDAA